VLTEQGLGVAIDALAEVAPVPTRVTAVPEGRLPPSVEATAYFTVSEALANASKHAQAATIDIAAQLDAGRLIVEVRDDGRGGADMSGGTGLAGIDDRVAAIGGTLRLDSPAGGGTRLRVELPCG
jgi:signal transduction histidine kinase